EGGVVAAAKHLFTFCRQVHVHAGPMAVRKVRMVDQLYTRKLFEVHYPGEPSRIVSSPLVGDYDAVVVTDFGHGAITPALIGQLNRKEYVAVNAQTNAANVGFNLITKYPRADYIVIDEPEARLAACDRFGPIEAIMEKLAAGRGEKMIVTQ